MTTQRSLYEPALDGLRLVAFLAVFFHHLPSPWASGVLARFHTHGWAGVELFFVISSFLLFRLLEAEHRRTGRIDLKRFYIRRILRIYPLMAVFSTLAFFMLSDMSWTSLMRYAGLLTFTDNIITALNGFKTTIIYTGHLWTLAFEFQFYLVLPFVFLAWKAIGTRAFLCSMAAFYVACVILRTWLTAAGIPHPFVWAIPLLQPDALLLGIVLATGALNVVPRFAWPVLSILGGTAFLLIRPPWDGPVQAVFSYMLVATASAGLVQSVRTISPLQRVFTFSPFVYLGTISFGLYVFHLVCIDIGVRILGFATGTRQPLDAGSWLALAAGTLVLTAGVSTLSYWFFELPFLRMKDRFAVVFGRGEIDRRPASSPGPVPAQEFVHEPQPFNSDRRPDRVAR